ncbi:DUF4148 domain-containing protein [Herbaspirillum sp. RU 5E]|jgi:hypothetical protein|uniref:DUF4148 domain-containing protein n=1 Tax=Herbaspirillum aquaticum TaxID=568783 RepID=A0A225SNJ1_9BURK|nr:MULTISPECIES: DUF4148 domain-containing protein [Herbaspirillum]MBW9336811.1 DUF4148 domain-containing protein [Herbaspirillum sp. RU 5E]MRT30516.1 DUF4148 domain-containing protein [Herbaspirillum sp. CAH-3]OWY32307.1 DUF4148 domain-containing protein [Herbaspirillum aquaticum]
MKTSHLVLGALATAFSLSAFAQTTVTTQAARDQANLNARNNYPVVQFQASKTRADVVAELQAARLGEPLQNTGAKPSVSDSSTQGQALDSSLYNGA